MGLFREGEYSRISFNLNNMQTQNTFYCNGTGCCNIWRHKRTHNVLSISIGSFYGWSLINDLLSECSANETFVVVFAHYKTNFRLFTA